MARTYDEIAAGAPRGGVIGGVLPPSSKEAVMIKPSSIGHATTKVNRGARALTNCGVHDTAGRSQWYRYRRLRLLRQGGPDARRAVPVDHREDDDMERKHAATPLAFAGLVASLLAGTAAVAGTIDKKPFGAMPDGTTVEVYTLSNDQKMSVQILTYGGVVHAIEVPDRDGKLGNVALGFAKLEDYLTKSPYFGNITGRYANRIAKGAFTLDGTTLQVRHQQWAERAARRHQRLRQEGLEGQGGRVGRASASS